MLRFTALGTHQVHVHGHGSRGDEQACRRRLGAEALEGRLLLSGVTLITHGFNSDVDGWVTAMAEAIDQRADLTMDQALYRVEVTDPGHDGGPLDVTSSWVSGPSPTDAATGFPEIAIVLDWSDVAGSIFASYTRSTFDVAAAIADSLVNANFLSNVTQPLATLPFHLLGHSRGASLVGELAHQLGTQGIWVDQVTTHDPHPVDGIGEPSGQDYGDAPMVAWGNVTFWDNYWRQGANSFLDFSGESVANTHDVELSNAVLGSGGYGLFGGGAHSDVHLWYHGTVDLSPSANDGSQDVPNDWYGGVHPDRDASGYFYSRLVNGQRTADGLADNFVGGSASRQPVAIDGLAWPNILELKVDAANPSFEVGAGIPLTYYYHDPDSSATVTFALDEDRSPFNANHSDLASNVIAASSSPVLANATPVVSSMAPGTYFVRATIADADGNTRYAYAATAVTIEELVGDLNGDSVVDGLDIDVLAANTGSANPVFDLNGDGVATFSFGASGVNSDSDYLVRSILGTEYGDANLDLKVDLLDLDLLGQGFSGGGTGWAWGDFNGSGGKADLLDLDILGQTYGFDATTTAPHPVGNGLAGDVDGDGQVQFNDLVTLSENFGRTDAAWADGDFDSNGRVDFFDLAMLAQNFGRSRNPWSV